MEYLGETTGLCTRRSARPRCHSLNQVANLLWQAEIEGLVTHFDIFVAYYHSAEWMVLPRAFWKVVHFDDLVFWSNAASIPWCENGAWLNLLGKNTWSEAPCSLPRAGQAA